VKIFPILPAANRMSVVIGVVPNDTPLTPTQVEPSGMITAADTPFPLNDFTPASRAACNPSASVGSSCGSEGALEQAVNFRASKNNTPIADSIRFIIVSVQTIHSVP
jgi:hypothetical protein